MRKIITVILLSIITLCTFSPSAQACRPAWKFTRGVVTIVSSPLEIPYQARVYWKEGAKKTPHILVWIFCGAVKGGVNMVTRVAVGLWDVVSFPFPIPKDYKPLTDTTKL